MQTNESNDLILIELIDWGEGQSVTDGNGIESSSE